jgi:hypothetical protein
MLFFLKLNKPHCGKILTVTSGQNSGNRRFNNNSTPKRRPIQTVDSMKNNTKRFAAIIGVGLALMMPINRAFGDDDRELFAKLSAEWWQWAFSIPNSVNPQVDATGENAGVGQRGPIWFLAGVFGGGTANRSCSVPQGTAFFFPVISGFGINTPGICGLTAESVMQLRNDAANAIAGAANLSVTLDKMAIKIPPRVQSKVFSVALPKENVFGSPCPPEPPVPAGIYSPAVADGFYVLLNPLRLGRHTLHFHADNPPNASQDVTYVLTVVPVSLQ